MRSGRFSGDELESEDRENSLSPSGDSPPSTGDFKASQKKRKATQKKVVSIPIKDSDLSPRTKGEAAPPADSWAWRKYGQKPIKGSPYPRGYYRCSSSKGCPARKQVERSRVDPTMLVVTYSSEHNHPSPPSSRTHHHHYPSPRGDIRHSPSSAATDGGVSPDVRDPVGSDEFNKFENLNDDFHGWFADMSYATLLDGPMLAETSADDPYATMLLPIMGEGEDQEESFFADLGELPECSMVFRRRGDMMTAAAGGSSGGARWCGAAS